MNAQLAARESAPVSLGDWILTLIILAIPIVGLVMLFVWVFSSGTHPSKQNYCRAVLIFALIAFVLAILFGLMGGFAAMHAARSMGGATL
ncbi:MAG: hypothetical protein OJF55_002940 [Rhodanobacteraceae bacterium]|jgi:phosphoglycerol transferase MdoB-like AlkP superfamily enzyme|nr:MAG: hypothetical protein OJF55_002940 [Rhodanobacteraceae bacterium]